MAHIIWDTVKEMYLVSADSKSFEAQISELSFVCELPKDDGSLRDPREFVLEMSSDVKGLGWPEAVYYKVHGEDTTHRLILDGGASSGVVNSQAVYKESRIGW